MVGIGQVETAGAVWRDVNREAFRGQAARDEARNFGLVFDKQDAHVASGYVWRMNVNRT